jgi:hypothetical protein
MANVEMLGFTSFCPTYRAVLDLFDCTLKCCAVHDECYYVNNCSSGSWPWPVGDMKKKNKCDSGPKCQQCNSQVTGCISLCRFGISVAHPPKKYFCASSGRFVDAANMKDCEKDHSPECTDC